MECLACDLASGRTPLLGGLDLRDREMAGRTLRWSAGRGDAGRKAQATRAPRVRAERRGEAFQDTMFQAEAPPDLGAAEAFAVLARAAFISS
jgi:hypothetical protein